MTGEHLTLEAGEYAVVRVDDAALLRDTWIWLLGSWLPVSGRREKNAPEFERYTSISEVGTPIGPVEIWIPLEPLAEN
jgi:AraC family transcriptional regulator